MCMAATQTAEQLAPANSTAAQQVIPYIQHLNTYVVSSVNAVLTSVDMEVIGLAKTVIITLLVIGVMLYFTRLNRRLGQEFMTGGVLIGLFLAFGVPYLTAVYC